MGKLYWEHSEISFSGKWGTSKNKQIFKLQSTGEIATKLQKKRQLDWWQLERHIEEGCGLKLKKEQCTYLSWKNSYAREFTPFQTIALIPCTSKVQYC